MASLACAIALAAPAGFAAEADGDDAAPAEDCGVASNCGGIGGWRLILLAAPPDDGQDPADGVSVEDPEEPGGNRAPRPEGRIDDLSLTAGESPATVDAAPHFSDPDGDALTYAASSSDEAVATASVSDSTVTVAPVAEGTATITVTARDPGGLTAQQAFGVEVSAASGFAPADQAEFDDHAVGKRIAGDDPEKYVDFVSAGRFKETSGSDTYEGRYTYTNTGANTGTLVFDYDDGDRCTLRLTFSSRTAGTSNYTCSDGESGSSNWRLVDIDDDNGGGDSYCRPGDVIEPGGSCDIYGTNIDFSVNSSGLGCVLARGITLCQGGDIDHRNHSLNGERYSLQATRSGSRWTIDDVDPKPPD